MNVTFGFSDREGESGKKQFKSTDSTFEGCYPGKANRSTKGTIFTGSTPEQTQIEGFDLNLKPNRPIGHSGPPT